MLRREFSAIAKRDWMPVTLAGESVPYWMRGIPESRRIAIYASGSFGDSRSVIADGNSYSDVIGGIDVFRFDKKDQPKGFSVNQDHYIVVIDPAQDDMLLVVGPIEDDHRWLDKMPEVKPSIVIYEFDEGDDAIE